jgi:hypothetical protein
VSVAPYTFGTYDPAEHVARLYAEGAALAGLFWALRELVALVHVDVETQRYIGRPEPTPFDSIFYMASCFELEEGDR